MSERKSKPTDAEAVAHVELLLGMLRDLSLRDPSPGLRERLRDLASQRLGMPSDFEARPRSSDPMPRAWLKPIFAIALMIVLEVGAAFVAHRRRTASQGADHAAKLGPKSFDHGAPVTSPPSPLKSALPKRHPAHPARPHVDRQMMTMRLPYSNNAVDTGTSAILEVSMSQSDLLSLGFPISATIPDRHFVAELTLGDDGLPRAISLPLPLEIAKEKK
jgi:hypothetical protein